MGAFAFTPQTESQASTVLLNLRGIILLCALLCTILFKGFWFTSTKLNKWKWYFKPVQDVSYVAAVNSQIFSSVIMSLLPYTGSSAMNKLRQSFRRKKDIYVPESSRPHQWQTDEEAVRSGKCNFAVKVNPSRTNMHECKTSRTLFTNTHLLQNALLTSLWRTHISEKPALQGRWMWLIISFYLGCKSVC